MHVQYQTVSKIESGTTGVEAIFHAILYGLRDTRSILIRLNSVLPFLTSFGFCCCMAPCFTFEWGLQSSNKKP